MNSPHSSQDVSRDCVIDHRTLLVEAQRCSSAKKAVATFKESIYLVGPRRKPLCTDAGGQIIRIKERRAESKANRKPSWLYRIDKPVQYPHDCAYERAYSGFPLLRRPTSPRKKLLTPPSNLGASRTFLAVREYSP